MIDHSRGWLPLLNYGCVATVDAILKQINECQDIPRFLWGFFNRNSQFILS